jgi:quinol monooxygenase YgiN
MSIRVVAHFNAKSGKRDELRKVLAGLVSPTRAESGCIAYDLMQNNDNPDDFTFIEEWESVAHLGAHLQSPHFAAAKDRFADLADGAPVVGVYSLVA